MKKTILIISLLSATILSAQTNLVPNGGLEDWPTINTLDNWSVENNVSQNTTDTQEGLSSALFNITDNTFRPTITTQVPLVENITYSVSFRFRYLDPNYNGAHPIRLGIIRAGSATTISSNSFALNNDWRLVETTFTPDQTGDYELSISTATFDGDTFNVLIDDIEILDPNTLSVVGFSNIDNKIKVFPTVTSDYINLQMDSSINIDSIKIFDLRGIEVDFNEMNDAKLDISGLSNGIYLVNVSSDQGISSIKIAKR